MERDTKKAPIGLFRVIGLDNRRDQGWKKGDYPTLLEAQEASPKPNHSPVRYRVYDDKGECVSYGFQHARIDS